MADAKKIASIVETAKGYIRELIGREFTTLPDDLITLEWQGWAPVDMARRQLDDEGCETTVSEYQTAWKTVNAWMEGMAEQRARDLYAIGKDE